MKKFTTAELIDLHVIYSNKMNEDKKKKMRLKHDRVKEEVIIMEKKLMSWKEGRRMSYDELFLEDFGVFLDKN